jgi:hypothetical protein
MIMNPATAFAGVRVGTTLLLTLFAVSACSDYDSVQPPPPELAPVTVTQGARVIDAAQPDTFAADALGKLRAVTARFHDVAVAESNGYSIPLTGCVTDAALGGMGFHVGKASAIDGTVDPLEPEVLLYEPQENGRRRLVAVEFIVPYELQPRDGPAPRLFGREFVRTDAFELWALHAWIWRNNPSGMFADFNPTVSCGDEPAAAHSSHSSGESSRE